MPDPDPKTAMAPHWLDDVFRHVGHSGGEAHVIQQFANHPKFVEAIRQAIVAEQEQQASMARNPHPGPGPGQAGRSAFLQAISGDSFGSGGVGSPMVG